MAITQADLDAARNDILAKVNDRFTALGKLISPDPTPVPPSPPADTPRIKFATHRYYLSGPKPAADFYDLQHSQWINLADFPGQKYRYASTARVLNDKPGDTQLLPPDRLAPYVTMQTTGQPVSREGGNDQLLNIGSLMFQSSVVNNLPVLLSGYDGLYLDEVDDTWLYGYPGTKPSVWLNPGEWQQDFLAFLKVLSTEIHARGKKLWVNLGTTGWGNTSAFPVGAGQYADAINFEYFIGRQVLGQSPMVDQELVLAVDRVRWIEYTIGKPCHAHVSTNDQKIVDYGFCAWLLGTEFRGSFTASADYAGGFFKPSTTLLSQALKLGAPTGPYQVNSTTLSRQFQGGAVAVGKTNQFGTIALAGTTPVSV